MDLFEAEILAKELISIYVPQYRFGWMNEKRVNGRCYYREKIIRLSRHRTPLRTYDSVRTTIMHEIAHAMHPGAKHGPVWQLQMIKFGLKPDRCSSDKVDESSLANWRATCPGCGKVSYMMRKARVTRSCGFCSGGRYNEKYKLIYLPM